MEGKEKGEEGAPLCAASLIKGSKVMAAVICSFGMIEVEEGDCSELEICLEGRAGKKKGRRT